jgi:hypothetical protein
MGVEDFRARAYAANDRAGHVAGYLESGTGICNEPAAHRNPRVKTCTVGICERPAVHAGIWCREHYGMNNGD